MTENNRRAKFYKLTRLGRGQLEKRWPAGTGSLQPLRESSS